MVIPIVITESAILKTGSKKVNSFPPKNGNQSGQIHVNNGN
jgi:hypothetical protein